MSTNSDAHETRHIRTHPSEQRVLVLLFGFICAFISIAPATSQDTPRIAASEDRIIELLNNFEPVRFDVSIGKSEDRKLVEIIYDFHILTETPVDAIYEVFQDRKRHTEILPGLLDYSWTYTKVDGQDRIEEYQYIGISFMGHKTGYRYILEGSERFDGNTYSFEWSLKDSLDGKVRSLDGSWFVTRIMWDGKPYTYMRYTNVGEMMSQFPGFASVMRHFAPVNTSRLFASILEAASERQNVTSSRER